MVVLVHLLADADDHALPDGLHRREDLLVGVHPHPLDPVGDELREPVVAVVDDEVVYV